MPDASLTWCRLHRVWSVLCVQLCVSSIVNVWAQQCGLSSVGSAVWAQ